MTNNSQTDGPFSNPTNVSRRNFMRNSAIIAGSLAVAPMVAGQSKSGDTIRVGLIGCGGRGTGAARNAMEASGQVKIAALADLFPDRVSGAQKAFADLGERSNVPQDKCFVGFDAFRELIDNADVDSVILATPPHFRPMMIEYAVNAGKHVFTEKPVAVDPAGIRTVIAAAQKAKANGQSIVAGTQRRHEACYQEAMKRIHDGAIGDIVTARCYWNMGGLWMKEPRPEWTDMEWQIRNWLYFTWLSGDHICEQHVHNLDVVNWAVGAHPETCMGMGGRQVRTGKNYGQIFDHFAVEYRYPNGIYSTSMCRQTDGCAGRVEEHIQGTKGTVVLRPGYAKMTGATNWQFKDQNPNPYVQEHRDLIASINGSEYWNEGEQVAHSTLTAIMGRMSAYTGKTVDWDFAMNSKLDISPEKYEFGPIEIPPVPMPGRTPLI